MRGGGIQAFRDSSVTVCAHEATATVTFALLRKSLPLFPILLDCGDLDLCPMTTPNITVRIRDVKSKLWDQIDSLDRKRLWKSPEGVVEGVNMSSWPSLLQMLWSTFNFLHFCSAFM